MPQIGWVVKTQPQLPTGSELEQIDDRETILQKILNYLLDFVLHNDVLF